MVKQEDEQEAFVMIIEACRILGWQFVIPNFVEDDDEVPGLIIGTKKYVDKILKDDTIESSDTLFTPGSKL